MNVGPPNQILTHSLYCDLLAADPCMAKHILQLLDGVLVQHGCHETEPEQPQLVEKVVACPIV